MKRRLLLVSMIIAGFFAGCNKSDISNNPNNRCNDGRCGIAPGGCYLPPDCEGIYCTMDFRSVNLEVRHGIATVIPVDSFVVTDLAGVPLPAGPGGNPVYSFPPSGSGNFTIVNDSWVHGHQNMSMQVRAKAFLNGAEVFNEPFTIAADCCHVSKLSGKDVINIQ